jgi:hypothetical protein
LSRSEPKNPLRRRWSKISKTIQAALIGAAAAIVASVIAAIIPVITTSPGSPPSLNPANTTPSPNPANTTPSFNSRVIPPTRNQGVSVAVSNKAYRVIFPIVNSQAVDEQLERVTLFISFHGPPCAEIPPILLYKIQGSVEVNSSGRIRKGVISIKSGLASGFTVPAAGVLNFGCSIDQLQLEFLPPGATLGRLHTTPVVIDVPRKLNVTRIVLPQSMRQELHFRAPMPSIGNPNEVNYIAFHIITLTGDGKRLSSCFLLTGSQTSLRPGVQNCDSTVEGFHVFWREIFSAKHQFSSPRFKKLD